ncbi:Ig-like domain-containing protein [Heyndrickxia sp. NPDC080065]|uniref:Ig-like domain-containing protein n=1 Tax=Heyndrickxia sp. NPDC080065 TaxID=3390568 RepID=UPI003D06CC45
MKRFKNTKRIVFSMLVLLLAFSNAFLGVKGAKAESNHTSELITSLTKSLDFKKVSSLSNESDTFKDSDKVRVIVELEGKPAIETATDQGVRYKDLSESKKDSIQSVVKKEQNNFISTLKSKKINLSIKNTFTTVVNGVSGTIEYGKIKELEKLPNVSGVYLANEYEAPITPNMVTSKEQVGARETWKLLDYKGEGMIVGIIDSGIDPSHKDMILSEGTKPKLTEESLLKAKSKAKPDELPGKYYTAKVPYGYNYFDKNDDIIDTNPKVSMHGMHVAGTVAANGDEDNGGIKGVAPEAQLLALKVFGNNPEKATTSSDIYIKAIDDAIILGADVLNMSLGSTAGFVDPNSPDQMAIKRAVNNGVVMSISAGNSNNFAGSFGNPLASNPDIGVVGSPSVSNESISVASLENTHMNVDGLTYAIDGDVKESLGFLSAGKTHPNDVEQKSFEILAAGLGKPEEFEGKDFKNKYALVQRGELDFVTKALNAQKAGAAGVIIYNNQSGIVSMASDPAITIPQLFLQQTDGAKLKEAIDAQKKVEISFTGKKSEMVNPSAGQMSDFTSWGLTPSLDFKPEITAPGGQIYSTLNNNEYGLKSGTSMAAPHVAGGSALVLQRVQKVFPNLDGADKVSRAKLLMMNTAIPVKDPTNNFYSPRRQGAGLMKLDAAVETPVYVTNKGTDQGKIALKEINENTVSFTLTATNFSDKDVTYHVDTKPLTDSVKNGKNQLSAQVIKDADVKIDKPELTIASGKSEDVTITIDLSKADATLSALMENGYFVEGFVTFTSDEESGIPNLSVPYVGFKGDWNKAPVLDPMIYDKGSFYDVSGMINEDGDYLGYNPVAKTVNKNKIAFSPNGDKSSDKIIPVLTFLRNSTIVEYSILDEKNNEIRKVYNDNYERKNYFDTSVQGSNNMYTFDMKNTAWDGKNQNNEVVPDGQYYYQIKTQVDYPGKAPQVLQVPVIVDTKAPELSDLAYDSEKGILSFNASDKDGSGINYITIFVDGKEIGSHAATDATSYKVEIPDLAGKNVKVVAIDYAGNKTEKELNGEQPGNPDPGNPGDKAPDAPVVNPVSDKDTTVTGTAEKGSTIEVYAKEVKLGSGVSAEDGTFSVSISKQKAGTKLTVTAKNSAGVSKATEVEVLDKTAPEAPKVNSVSDKDTKVTGTAEAGSTVTVFAGKATLGTGTTDKNGKFSITINKQKAGTALTVTATDKAGNVSKATKVVVLDKTAPAAPSVNTVTSTSKKVTGKAEAGSKVTIKVGNKQIGSGKADKNGKFSISIKEQKANTTLSATATDKAGNESKAKKVTVKPTVPTVNTVKSSSTKVTGKAKAGAKVYVKAGSKVLGSATANKSGTYSVKIKKQKAGTTLNVYAVENGKKSGSKKATVKK